MTKTRGNPKFEFRVHDERRAKWQQAADIEQRTLSDFIKVATDEKTERILTLDKIEQSYSRDPDVIEEPMTLKNTQDYVLDFLWQAKKSKNRALTREQFIEQLKKGESE